MFGAMILRWDALEGPHPLAPSPAGGRGGGGEGDTAMSALKLSAVRAGDLRRAIGGKYCGEHTTACRR